MKKRFLLLFCLMLLAGCAGSKVSAELDAGERCAPPPPSFAQSVGMLAPDESVQFAETPFGANVLVSAGQMYTSGTNNFCRKVCIYSATKMQVVAVCQNDGVWVLMDPIFEPVSVYYE